MKTKIRVLLGDITKLTADAIVNAANDGLRPGAGVCGAIYDAAGLDLVQETRTLGRCSTGHAKTSRAYNIQGAKFIIHAVGPVYGELDNFATRIPKRKSNYTSAGYRGEDILLDATYKNALIEAKNNGCRSIAFPCISTGVYGYPTDEATLIAIKAVVEFCSADDNAFDEVIFCCFLEKDYDAYKTMTETLTLPNIDMPKIVAENFVFEPKPVAPVVAAPPVGPLDTFLHDSDATVKASN